MRLGFPSVQLKTLYVQDIDLHKSARERECVCVVLCECTIWVVFVDEGGLCVCLCMLHLCVL